MSGPGCDEWVRTGRRMREIRLDHHKITQAEMARRCCVTQQAVSLWERGEAMPDRTSRDFVAKQYGFPLLFAPIAMLEAEAA